MGQLAKSVSYQPEVQGLRALAVVLVLLYHGDVASVPGGYTGVDVFFVISGYLITALLLREIERDADISLVGFYGRRARRLLPAASVVLLATLAAAWAMYSPLALKTFASSAAAMAVYVSNLWFAYLSTDYLAEGTDANPLLHTWSLGVEEQFYLLWPLVLLVLLRTGAQAAFRARLYVTLLAVGTGSFGFNLWLTGASQPWAFFGLPARAWELAVGALLAVWFSTGRPTPPRVATVASWTGFVLILLGAGALDRKTAFPGAAALLPVLGAAMLIVASRAHRSAGLNRWLATRPMQWIGDLSYPLYLWHWPIFVFAGLSLPEHASLAKALSAPLVLLLSWGTVRFIEDPFRSGRVFPAGPVRTLRVSAVAMATCAVAAAGTWGVSAHVLEDPVQRRFQAAKDDIPRLYDEGCHADQFVTVPRDCAYGNPDGDVTVVLFGDSHAAHWFPALERLATARQWKLVSFTKSGCPSVEHTPWSPLLGRPYRECAAWRAEVLTRIRAMMPELVVLSNFGDYSFDSADPIAWWRARARRILERLAPLGKATAIIRDVPHPGFSVPECLSRAHWLGRPFAEACRFAVAADEADGHFVGQREAASGFSNVRVVDMHDAVCQSRPCTPIDGRLVKYKDGDHLSASFSARLADHLGHALDGHGMSGSRRHSSAPGAPLPETGQPGP